MKFYRLFLPFLMVLVMVGISFANEERAPNVVQDAARVQQNSGKTFFRELVPWNMYLGGGTGFAFGADWVFGDWNYIYIKGDDSSFIPSHIWLWTIGTHAFYADGFNFLLQPNILYFYERGISFKFSLGPELGYINETGFDYGFSLCIGTIIDMFNVRVGYLVRMKSPYFHILFNLPVGIGMWV
ncbi:hypothetical protein [uncultured Fibrobacter sp.]|uniref:hypothetical protein n=1 Tax=uncultured Fibrobacter sp. TaxID=261512 RepID=UPI0025EF9EB2|nr:hypothetical protein [uncultured Fibrobacter sp.]